MRLLLILGCLLLSPQLRGAELVMGVFPRFNPDQTQAMFSPLTQHLSQVLGQKVQLKVSRNFQSFLWALQSGRFDIVHFNQYHYVRAHKELGYQVILRNEEFGESTISGVLVVRQDSPVKRLADLRGRKVMFGGGREAMMSYIVPRQMLKRAGLEEGDYQPLFARNPPNAVVATFLGDADAAGAGHRVTQFDIVNRGFKAAEMRVLARGAPLAHLPWAVRPGLDPTLRRRIQGALADLSRETAGQEILRQAQLTALIPTQDSDYDPHRAIIAEVLGEQY